MKRIEQVGFDANSQGNAVLAGLVDDAMKHGVGEPAAITVFGD